MSLIVTGTGTGVGKTIVSALVLARHGRRARLAYWKPVATGGRRERDRDRVRRWCGELAAALDETYLFAAPVSPHLAARREGRKIEPDLILDALVAHAAADPDRNLVIEGAGGVLVPLTDHGYLNADLYRDLHLPCLVAASSALGTINHTLLTLEALRARRVEVAGVVLSGPPDRENRRAIERFGKVAVIAEVPRIPRLGRAALLRAAPRFDRRGALRRYFE